MGNEREGGTDVREAVRERYAAAALSVSQPGEASGCSGCGCDDPITSDLYDAAEVAGLPDDAVAASLGCGNPLLLAELQPGEVVLDLGSGGGIDVLLSARRVGPGGKAYGLDMTDEMLALARENQRQAGATNVEFLKGHIEDVPLPDASVDVVISNCVINLSVDKDQALREAFRVLKPGGRLAVADIVVRGEVPEPLRQSLDAWAGCIAGALEEGQYAAKLAAAGFTDIAIEPTRVYQLEDVEDAAAQEFLAGLDSTARQRLEGTFCSAFIRSWKPGAGPSAAGGQ